MKKIYRIKKNVSRYIQYISYVYEWYVNPARFRKAPTYPTVLNLPITDNCNSRCVMCSVWKTHSKNEISVEELSELLADRLFSKVRHVGISGGEPSLRSDLVEVVDAIISTLPSVRSISITTHGYHTKRWERYLPAIMRICEHANVDFTLNLSLDGIGSVHDTVRGIPGAYDRLIKTRELARQLGTQIEFQTTVLSYNIYSIVNILYKVRKMKDKIVFRLATEITRLDNNGDINKVALNEDEKSFFADFLESEALLSVTASPARRLFYHELANRLITGQPRMAPCAFQREGILLSAKGQLFHCSLSKEPIGNALHESAYKLYFSTNSKKIRKELINRTCPICMHDQSGYWPPLSIIGNMYERSIIGNALTKTYQILTLLMKYMQLTYRVKKALKTKATHKSKKQMTENAIGSRKSSYDQAVIIGAYGGEHVGDAAILGGVILRLHLEYGVRKVYVASIRPHRTKRWVRSLDVPVKVEVIEYKVNDVVGALAGRSMLVYGGGPLMELPRLLVKHVEAAANAVSKNKMFIIEGVGLGPFKSTFSRQMTRRLIELADKISIRTSSSMNSPMLTGVEAIATRDPAFDYLSSRANLSKITEKEMDTLNALLSKTDGRRLVGINLRPLWHKYARNMSSEQVRKTEEGFLRHLAEGMKRYSDAIGGKVSYVFFPMNADQFGFSDFEVAYKLQDFLDDSIDFRVWEIEPGVDAVLYLLRRLDAVVAMRFHACIFSLSQQVPTIGIDYSLGTRGKVGELFEDNKLSHLLSRVDNFSAEWFVRKIQSLVETKSKWE